MSSGRGHLTGSWTGWVEDLEGARCYLPGAVDETNGVDPDAFPGRWSSMRDFPAELEPLPQVAGSALARAGWWRPGSGSVCSGGLIVGADGAFIHPSIDFATELRSGWSAKVSPTDFIHSLPSTAASLLTKLYGFADYQATLVHGSHSGDVALGHASDLLAAGRLERALVTTLSVATSRQRDAIIRIAVAACLEPGREHADTPPPIDEELAEILQFFGNLAAIPIVRALS